MPEAWLGAFAVCTGCRKGCCKSHAWPEASRGRGAKLRPAALSDDLQRFWVAHACTVAAGTWKWRLLCFCRGIKKCKNRSFLDLVASMSSESTWVQLERRALRSCSVPRVSETRRLHGAWAYILGLAVANPTQPCGASGACPTSASSVGKASSGSRLCACSFH